MATQIGLLSPPRDSSLDGPVNGKQRRKTLSRNFTAWALFNLQALHVYILFEPPLINKPPDVPLPDPATNPEWYGQICLKYPGDTKLHTTHFPYQFQAQCQVRVIMNDMWIERFGSSRQSSPEGGTTMLPSTQLEQTNEFYARLKAWFDSLPDPLTPPRIVFPSQILLHYGDQFLVQPLNTLGFWSLSMVHAIVSQNHEIHEQNNSELKATQSTLLLAAKGLYEQSASFYLDRLTLQLLRSKMRPQERNLLESEVLFYDRDYAGHHLPGNQHDKSIKSEENNKKKDGQTGSQTVSDRAGDNKDQGSAEKEPIREVRSKWVVTVRSVDDDPEIHRLQKLVMNNLKLDETFEWSDEDEGAFR
ncbi:hypothetical protein QC763_0087920 [Podospora pseudopauciseta]|uniref:HNH nuclease domain-containing protein n=1 Tax=Podospora pseudopauciseta TaxID=2093780 RepID=A0ABR0H3E5_9PEZI|nr:hypothetical protein QC763_0087920 [Podospora pseudopauciseta]